MIRSRKPLMFRSISRPARARPPVDRRAAPERRATERRQDADRFEGPERRGVARRAGVERRALTGSEPTPPPDSKKSFFERLAAPLVRLLTPVGGRTTLDALAQADALLQGPALTTQTDQNATVVSDPSHVNDGNDTRATSARHLDAQAQLDANAALEASYLERLPADQRAQYEAVKAQVLTPPAAEGVKTPPAGDAVAALALQTMLLRGALPGGADLTGAGTTLDHLSALTTAPLAVGIDRQALVSDLVQELATPASIAQRGKGTCAATSVELHLAHNTPAEYARLVAGLASPTGRVELSTGEVLRRELGTREDDGSSRSVPQRLLAPALMEVGNGDWNYVNNDDQHVLEGEPKGSGLTSSQVDRMLEAVYGRDFAFSSGLDSEEEKTAALDLMAEQTAAGNVVLAGLTWGEGGHKVVVTSVTDDTVRYLNPWGRVEEMPRDEFSGRLNNVNYDPNA